MINFGKNGLLLKTLHQSQRLLHYYRKMFTLLKKIQLCYYRN